MEGISGLTKKFYGCLLEMIGAPDRYEDQGQGNLFHSQTLAHIDIGELSASLHYPYGDKKKIALKFLFSNMLMSCFDRWEQLILRPFGYEHFPYFV